MVGACAGKGTEQKPHKEPRSMVTCLYRFSQWHKSHSMEQGDASPARALDQLVAYLRFKARFKAGKRNLTSASHLTQKGRSKGFADIEWAHDTYGIIEERIHWSRRSGDEFFAFVFNEHQETLWTAEGKKEIGLHYKYGLVLGKLWVQMK